MENNEIRRRWIPGRGETDPLGAVAYTGEAQAHTFVIEGWDGQQTVPITGDITANFLAGNDVLIPLTGSLENGRAVVTLNAACYAVAGRFTLAIFAADEGRTVCVYCGYGVVHNTSSDTVYDPEDVVPSLQELLAQIAAMQAGTDRANAAAAALEALSVTAHAVSGQTPTAAVTRDEDGYHIDFGLVPSTVSSQVTDYQVSASGTAVPAGAWVATLPSCPQGQFLWTRTVITWNGGQTTTVYSVSRQGVDGSGAVSTVNGQNPDANGNVALPTDSAPASGSLNYVTSGGVYSAVQGVQEDLDELETALGMDTEDPLPDRVDTLETAAARHDQGIADLQTAMTGMASAVAAGPEVSEITEDLSVTRTSGSCTVGAFRAFRCGSLIMLSVTVTSTASVAAGSNVGILQVSGIPMPAVPAKGAMYGGTRVVVGNLDDTGKLEIRNEVATYSSGSSTNLSFTYIAAPETPAAGE